MKATLGDKIGSSLAKLRLQLPEKRVKPATITKIPSIDEGQLAGELLAWLQQEKLLSKDEDLLHLQGAFFADRDRV
jgi:hypothetical protein